MKNEKRRKLLKSIAAGSGAVLAGKSLPESWSRPIVDSVILPGHAQTSGFSGNYHYRQLLTQNTAGESMFARLLDATVSAAEAQVAPDIVDYCVDVFADGTWRAAIRTTIGGRLQAIWWTPQPNGTVGGPAVLMNATLCDIAHPPVTFQVTSGDATQVNVVIVEGSVPNPITMIPAGTCPFGDPTNETCPD